MRMGYMSKEPKIKPIVIVGAGGMEEILSG